MKKLLLIAALAVLVSGCAMKKATIDSFVEPMYQQGTLKSVAIFPVQNAAVAPQQAMAINAKIVSAMQRKSPGIGLVSPAESARKINDAGAAEHWSRFLEDFVTSGLVNKKYLNELANALGTDAVMQGYIGQIAQKDGMQFGDGVGVTSVSISYALIDLRNAKVVWQAHTTRRSQTGSFGFHVAPEVSEAMGIALDKLIENMPAL